MRVAQWILCPVLVGVALSASLSAIPAAQTSVAERETVAHIQKAREPLPYYGVVDFLAFGVEGGTVTLFGYAYRGSLKTEAVPARSARGRRGGPDPNPPGVAAGGVHSIGHVRKYLR